MSFALRVLLLLCSLSSVVVWSQDCTWSYSPPGQTSTYVFDLSGLTRTNGGFLTGAAATFEYQFNPCGVVNVSASCSSGGATICQSENNIFVAVVASWTRTPAPTWQLSNANDPTAGVQQVFNNGDSCSPGVRSATITYHCDTVNSTSFTISESPTCNFNVDITSTLACPNVCNCNGHGTCNSAGTCNCDKGYSGPACKSSSSANTAVVVAVIVAVLGISIILSLVMFLLKKRRITQKYATELDGMGTV